MTDPHNAQPENASVPDLPAPPPAAYDAASTPASAYPADAGTPAPPPAAPAYSPPQYAPPASPTSSYVAAAPVSPYSPAPYGTTVPPYGTQYPVQTTPGAPPVAPYGYGAYAAPRTNGLAVASMILSIVGFIWVLPLIGSVAGAIMGHISLGQIRRTGESGRGMALAGVIVGWAGVALLVVGVLFIVFVSLAAAGGSNRYGA